MRLKNTASFNIKGNQENLKTFKVVKKRNGIYPAVITIDGFLNEGLDNAHEWEIGMKEKYSLNAWYHLEWQSENMKKLLKRIIPIFAVLVPTNMIPFASLITIPIVGMSMPSVIKTWRSALKQSEEAGKLLSQELTEHECDEFILIGHSLGSRVIYNCLDNLDGYNKNIIYDIHLLGGAVSNNATNWLKAEKTVKNKIYNYYSFKDWVLQTAYRLGTFDGNPIGRTEIATSKTENINVTEYVNSHLTFKKQFGHYIR